MREPLHEGIRFAAVGVANTAIGLTAIYVVMFFFQTGPAIANAVGYAIGLSMSFLLNRSWTFGSTQSVSLLLPRFLTVVTVSYLLNLGAVLAATSLAAADPYFAQVLGVGIYTTCVFFGCRRLVFA
jgi:putative flippase GtrA